MIVKLDWPEEGSGDGAFYLADPKHESLDSSQLHSHRDVPHRIWAAYETARAIVAGLERAIEALPLLPRYTQWQAEMKVRQAKADAFRLEAERRYAKDLAIQEEIRRAGALAPLLKDCPTDEPVRIGLTKETLDRRYGMM